LKGKRKMETKLKRTKVKVILPIILPVLFITGILAVSGHADKPDSPPGLSKPKPKQEPILISVTGAIEGEGNPYEISVVLVDPSFDGEAGSFIANPDYPPALKVTGPGRHRRLRYYYCDNPDHEGSGGICENPSHSPDNYKCLTIYNGILEKKTDKVIFPDGNRWAISWKKTMGVLIEGTLSMEVRYEVLKWGTP